jgi:hypothetical protein
MRPPREDSKPWYKQFWPWFLISLPLSVVIASMVTINIAFKTSDGLVSDDYYKEGLAMRKNADSTARAKALGISGQVDYDTDTGAVSLLLEGDLSRNAPLLVLEIIHPTRPGRDQAINMTLVDGDRYAGRIESLEPANWKLRLMPNDKEWRVEGRMLVPGGSGAVLN